MKLKTYSWKIIWLVLAVIALGAWLQLNRYQVSRKDGTFFRYDKLTGVHSYKQFGQSGWSKEKSNSLDFSGIRKAVPAPTKESRVIPDLFETGNTAGQITES